MRLAANGLLCASALVSSGPAPARADPPKGGCWKKTYGDEFDRIDRGKWSLKWPQYYGGSLKLDGSTRRKAVYNDANVSVGHDPAAGGSVLRLLTKRERTTISWEGNKVYEYSSGGMFSGGKFTQLYGYFETRAKLPTTPGLDPAFWLTHETHWPPEIDVVESPGSEGNKRILQNVHFRSGDGKNANTWKYHAFPAGSSANDYHTYGVHWRKDFVQFYVDGAPSHRVTAGVPQDALYLLLTAEVDGGAGDAFYGDPARGAFPVTSSFDYVRVWQESSPCVGGSAGGTPAGGTTAGGSAPPGKVGPPAGAVPALPAGRVRLAAGPLLTGASQDFGAGTYRADKGHFSKVGNDRARSLRVSRGTAAAVCESESVGKCTLYGPGDHDLAAQGMSNSASFLRVGPLSRLTTVRLYKDRGGRGVVSGVTAGVRTGTALGAVGDDAARSVSAPIGVGARLCDKADGKGTCLTFGPGSRDLPASLAGKVSYVRVGILKRPLRVRLGP